MSSSPVIDSVITRYLAIAVPCTLRRVLHYLPITGFALPVPGIRVRVPFGRQELIGIVLHIDSETTMAAEKLRPALAYLDPLPLLEPALLDMYRWASQYYLHPIGLCVQTSLPKALREGRDLPSLIPRVWQLTAPAEPAPSLRSSLQKEVLHLLTQYQALGSAEISVLLNRPAAPYLKALAEKGLIRQTELPEQERKQHPLLRQQPLTLNAQQAAILEAMQASLGSFSCHLLEGITGSGKTEIYLQLIARVLETGQQALVLIPEISLTPQTLARFEQRFNCDIVVFHSALTDKQRLEGWMKARDGSAGIIIGTRSAIFTPLKSPGVLIIDEEHDDSYKQQDGFRYSARDLGIWRAHQLGLPVLLGTATPSLESLNNALKGRYQLHSLEYRAGQATLPTLRPVDLRRETIREGFSNTLLATIGNRLLAGEQVLVFLNRRGFAPMLRCQLCGWIAECPRCERAYTLHQQPAALRCHHCEAHKPVPLRCGECHQDSLSGEGLGTEKSEHLLAEEFPDFPVIRIDSDTTRAQGSLQALMDQVNSGIPCILVGTQMIAKGHHFPRVTLVAVLDADSGLFSADFRSQENLGQLLTQVAGRAGRSDAPGTVLIQTWYPEHPTLLSLLQEGYGSFARQLLQEREVGALPPFVHFVLIRAEASRRELPLEFLGQVRHWLEQQAVRGLICFGPMPSPYGKKAGKFRTQLILQASRRNTLQRLGDDLITAIEALPSARKVRWSVDVDPLDFS